MGRKRMGARMAGRGLILGESILFSLAGVIFYLAALAAIGWQFYRQYRNMHSITVSIVTGAGGTIDSGAHGAQSGSAGLPAAPSYLKLQNFAFTDGTSGAPRATSGYKLGDDVNAKYELTGYGTNTQGDMAVGSSVVCTDPNRLA